MSAAPPTSAPSPKPRRRLLLVGIVGILAACIGGYFLFRPFPPPIPEVDLSNADSDVATAVNRAIDRVKADPLNGSVWGYLGMVLRAHDFDMPSVQAFEAAEKFDSANPKWPYLRGLTLVLYDPDAGLACLERAAAKSSESQPEPRLRLAEVLLDRGRVSDAEAAVAPIAQRLAGDARAGLVLARIAADRGEWAGVLARTEPLRNHPGAQRRAALLRADALRRLERTADADTEAKRAAGLPEDVAWDDRFVVEVEKLEVGGRADLRHASELLAAGQYGNAAFMLDRAAAKSRNPTPAKLLLAQTLNAAGDPVTARTVAAEAVRADPLAVEGWFQLGVAQFLTNDLHSAADSFEQVVKLKSDHALGYYNLGLVRKKLGDRAKAETAFEAALRCRPDHEPSRQELAELRKQK